MNVRRLIAQVVAAVVITATAIALVPSSAQAYGSWHNGASIVRPAAQNGYWYGGHWHRYPPHRWHRHWHRGYWH